jgi:hypothetical protein
MVTEVTGASSGELCDRATVNVRPEAAESSGRGKASPAIMFGMGKNGQMK